MTVVYKKPNDTKLINRIAINYYGGDQNWISKGGTHEWTFFPVVNVRKEVNRFLVQIEIPTLTEKEINIKVDKNLLTIKRIYCKSRKVGPQPKVVFPQIELSPADDTEHIQAAFKNGLLTIEIPVVSVPVATPRGIKINHE